MAWSPLYSHRQQADQDMVALSEGVQRAMKAIKLARREKLEDEDRALARQVTTATLANTQRQGEADALALGKARRLDSLETQLTDFEDMQTPGKVGPMPAGAPSMWDGVSPLTPAAQQAAQRNAGDDFKYGVLAKISTLRGQPKTKDQVAQEYADVATERTRKGELHDLEIKGGKTRITADEATANRQNAEAAEARRRTQLLGLPKPEDLEKIAGSEDNLRKEYVKMSQNFTDVQSAMGRVQASAENPSAAGDMSLIFAYMKMLDPGSTVREGEQAQAEQARGVPASILAFYNKAVTGVKLDDTQRKDFIDRAGKLFEREKVFQDLRAEQFTEIAKGRGYNPANVVIKLSPDVAKTVTTPEEYAALPAGAAYKDAQGNVRRKK